VVLKLRYSDFRTITRQTSLAEGVDSARELVTVAGALMDKTVEAGQRFRLLGIHGTNLQEKGLQDQAQLGLWGR
jgi:nucleotidyltransferase/DNA polymerase involved in DNA repair